MEMEGEYQAKHSTGDISAISCICPNVVLICTQLPGEEMPIIKSISSMRHRTREIASICRTKDEPVYLTTNGEGDLVVMTIDHYERLKAQVDLFEKLGVAQAQSARGKKGLTHRQMMTRLRRRMNVR
jgi:prevent-host-death family protein